MMKITKRQLRRITKEALGVDPFVDASTNVQTGVDNYVRTTKMIVKKMLK